MSPAEREGCAGAARLLQASVQVAGSAALLCTLLAGGLLAMGSLAGSGALAQAPAWAVLLLFPLERCLALRLHFDAGLFADLSKAGSLRGLDETLRQWRLPPAPARTRPLDERLQGTRRLLLQHLGVVALQFGVLVGALVMGLHGGLGGGLALARS